MLPRLLVSICHPRVGPVLAQLVLGKFSQVLWIKSIKAFSMKIRWSGVMPCCALATQHPIAPSSLMFKMI
jgi:hypothetical protein